MKFISLTSFIREVRAHGLRAARVACLGLVSVGVSIATLAAQTTTWTGATSTDWFNATNWSSGVPDPTIDVVIAPASRQPTLWFGDCRNLTVQAGTSLTVTGGIAIHGSASFAASVLGTGFIDFDNPGGAARPVTCTNQSVLPNVGVQPGVNLDFRDLRVARTLALYSSTTFQTAFIRLDGTTIVGSPTQLGRVDAHNAATTVVCDPAGALEVFGPLDLSCTFHLPRDFAATTVTIGQTATFTPSAGTIRILLGRNVAVSTSSSNSVVLPGVVIPSTSRFDFGGFNRFFSGVHQLGAVDNSGTLNVPTANAVGMSSLTASGPVNISGRMEPNANRQWHEIHGLALSAPLTIANEADVRLVPSSPTATPSFQIGPAGLVRLTASSHFSPSRLGLTGRLQVDGQLEILSGNEFRHDRAGLAQPTRLTIASTGSLRMLGTVNDPVTMTGDASGSYECEIGGTFEARDYTFSELGPTGVRILPTATIGAAPNDLRDGTYLGSSSQLGAVLLDLDRSQPTTLTRPAFHNPTHTSGAFPTGVYGVRARGSGPITIDGAVGNLAGPANADDPHGRITWTGITLGTLTATSSLSGVALTFRTNHEFQVQSFQLYRGPSATGPWTSLTTWTPRGSTTGGATYTFQDTPPTGVPVHYVEVEDGNYVQRLQSSISRVVAKATGQRLANPTGRTLFVGPGGYASISAAVAAAAPGSTILVQGGSHAGFTVEKPLTIVGLGAPLIVMTSESVVIRNVGGASASVVLANFSVLGGGTAPPLIVENCSGPVVLDRLFFTGTREIVVRSSSSVFLQFQLHTPSASLALDLDGSSGILSKSSFGQVRLRNGAHWVQLDSGLLPAPTVDATSTLRSLAGVMPVVDCPPTWTESAELPVDLAGVAGESVVLLISASIARTDLSNILAIDTPLMLGITESLVLGATTFPGPGPTRIPLRRGPSASLRGITLPLQALTLSPNSTGRFSTLRTVTLLP